MPTQEIISYINEARKAGLDKQTIRDNLLRTGWPEHEIDEALGLPSTPIPARAGTENKKLMSVLAYIGILVLIPYFSGEAKKDQFVKFHTQQGLVLFVLEVAILFLNAILPFGFVWPLLGIGLAVLAVAGILNAAQGRIAELPLVGSCGKKFKI